MGTGTRINEYRVPMQVFNAFKKLEKELEAVKGEMKKCFIAGYEHGHNDTVESAYGSADDIFEDIKDELLKGGNDGMDKTVILFTSKLG